MKIHARIGTLLLLASSFIHTARAGTVLESIAVASRFLNSSQPPPVFVTTLLSQLESQGVSFHSWSRDFPPVVEYTLVVDVQKSRELALELIERIRAGKLRSLFSEDWDNKITGIVLKTRLPDDQDSAIANDRILVKAIDVRGHQSRGDVEQAYLKLNPGKVHLAALQSIPQGHYLTTSPALVSSLSDRSGRGFYQEGTSEITTLSDQLLRFVEGGDTRTHFENRVFKLLSSAERPLDPKSLETVATWITPALFEARNFQDLYNVLRDTQEQKGSALEQISRMHAIALESLRSPDVIARRNAFFLVVTNKLLSLEDLSSFLPSETDEEILLLILEAARVRTTEITEDNYEEALLSANLILSRIKRHRRLLSERMMKSQINEFHPTYLTHVQFGDGRRPGPVALSAAARILRGNLDFLTPTQDMRSAFLKTYRNLHLYFLDDAFVWQTIGKFAQIAALLWKGEISEEEAAKRRAHLSRLPDVYSKKKMQEEPLLFQQMNEIRTLLDMMAVNRLNSCEILLSDHPAAGD